MCEELDRGARDGGEPGRHRAWPVRENGRISRFWRRDQGEAFTLSRCAHGARLSWKRPRSFHSGRAGSHSAGLVPRVAEADLRRASSRTGRGRRWLGYGRAQSLWPGGPGGGLLGLPPFEEVIVEHGAVVLKVCRAVAGPDDADDAWSETFLSALQAYPRLAAGSNVRGWLVTIAYRKAVDRIRAGRRAPIPAGTLPERPSFDREESI